MKILISYGKIKVFALLLLSLCLLALSQCGYCSTTNETDQYMKIPIEQWNSWKSEWATLNQDLIQCQQDLKRLKKPSAELVQQLQQAEKMLSQLQTELAESKKDLMSASSEAAELRTLLQTLRTQIDKERRVHKRQVWQNRFWCLLFGAGIGIAASK